ncbi:MAG: cupin [Calditrichia bacterium]
MQKYYLQTDPVRIPAQNNKVIEEHFGLQSTKSSDYSIARMSAPAGWEEPFQTPEFDEIILMGAGSLRADVDGKILEISGGESLLVRKGVRVQYSNPFNETAEYWSICIPAFSPDSAHREYDGEKKQR